MDTRTYLEACGLWRQNPESALNDPRKNARKRRMTSQLDVTAWPFQTNRRTLCCSHPLLFPQADWSKSPRSHIRTCKENQTDRKKVGQAIYTFEKSTSMSRKKKKKKVYRCSKFNAYCLLRCREHATLIYFTLPTHCDLASRSRSPKRAWGSRASISLPSCQGHFGTR